jgi:hypothetical protein
MMKLKNFRIAAALTTCSLLGAMPPAAAAVAIQGQVQAGGGALAGSTVTLWAAGAGAPKQLAQAKTGNDGQFQLGSGDALGADVVL